MYRDDIFGLPVRVLDTIFASSNHSNTSP